MALTFRALTREPELLPRLLLAHALPEEARETVRRRTAPDTRAKKTGAGHG
ncbi:hypothetical protein ACFQVA_22875 [Actinomadura keratinilytica]